MFSRRAAQIGLTAAVFSLVLGSVSLQQAQAGLPPVPTETPPATPSVQLNPPTEIRYNGLANRITWIDNALGEEGYRIIVTFGNETRSFEVGANVQELQLPDDFRPACPTPGPNVDISVTAFLGTNESEPGTFFIGGICPPATITPTPTATSLPSLPATGAGQQPGGNAPALTLIAALALIAASATLAGVLYKARR